MKTGKTLIITDFITAYIKTDGESTVRGHIRHENIELPVTGNVSVNEHITEIVNINDSMAEMFYGYPEHKGETTVMSDIASWYRVYESSGRRYEELSIFKYGVK